MEEIWKEVYDICPLLQVSNLGRVRKILEDRYLDFPILENFMFKILNIHIKRNNTLTVNVKKNSKNRNFIVKKLVYYAFIGNIINKTPILHLDRDFKNCRADNLIASNKTEANMFSKYPNLKLEDLGQNRKICIDCKEIKEINEREFSLSYITEKGTKVFKSSCVGCENIRLTDRRRERPEYLLKYREVNKNILKDKHLRKYGSSLEYYQNMLVLQNSVCAICKQKDPDKDLALDHNHKTNKIRGLLCRNCNIGLGLFKDSLENLGQALEYLKKYQ